MTTGLPVTGLIAVSVSLSPSLAQFANLNTPLVLGNSDVIDTRQRLRTYTSAASIATDFGTSAPEYLAGLLYFSQVPAPTSLLIGRWAQSATHGLLVCGPLSAAQKLLSAWTPVTNGGFKIQVDGGALTNITGINLSAALTLNGIATLISTALTGAAIAATCAWNGSQFIFRSNSTGAASTVAALQPPTAGTDISAQLMGTAGTLSYTVAGIVAESAVACVTLFDTTLTTPFYGLMFASPQIVDADHLAVAAYIEASGTPHLYGLTTSAAASIVSPDTTSIGFQLKALGYNRTFYQYSSLSVYAIASIFGRMSTVQFTATNSTITMMWQQEPGVTAELLTATQAATLNGNNYNYFASFNNGTSILVNGACASGQFIDTVWGVDWLSNQIQTNVYNLLFGQGTKVPQTDAGNHLIATAIEAACVAAVNNGFLGAGVWNAAGFGQLVQGGFLSKGYYVYTPPISTQSQSDRTLRKSVPFQVAAKLAGAVHTVNVLISVNP